MPGVQGSRIADATGVLFDVFTDIDSGVERSRVRVPLDEQPLKIRIEALLDESADALMRLQYRIDHVADYGLGPAAQTVLLNALNARKTAALSRDLTLLTAWRNA